MPLLKLDSILLEPIDCNTMNINPHAISSREALALALLNKLAVAVMGNPGNGFALISRINRLILEISPSFANSAICITSSVLSMMRLNPCRVPPPMPIPPICRMSSPSHCTRLVPVPMLTTIMRSSLLSYFAPNPSAINSSLLEVGSP